VYFIESQSTFWRNISPSSSGLKIKLRKKAMWKQVASRAPVTLKMEAVCSSEILIEFQQTTWRSSPEDSTAHNHHCENLKS
jgi:hypothetical protein